MNLRDPLFIEALSLNETIAAIWHTIHSMPELGFHEHRTSGFIFDTLSKLGLEPQWVAGVGVIAVLKGDHPGSTIALRAEIDGLPIQEETAVVFRSKIEGQMHACGHDAHSAMLIGAANLLLRHRSCLHGTVKLIFQPAEEDMLGAKVMIKAGVLDYPMVDQALSLHVSTDLPFGYVETCSGPFLSSMDEFDIEIFGKGGNGSTSCHAANSIVAGANLTVALQTIVSTKLDPSESAVVSVCQFHSVAKDNDRAQLNGTIRCVDPRVRERIHVIFESIVRGVCNSMDAGFSLSFKDQAPSIRNDALVHQEFLKCIDGFLEANEIKGSSKPRMYSDDFAFYSLAVPSLYLLLGARDETKGIIYPVHNSRFIIGEELLPVGVVLLAKYCLKRLA